MPNRIIKESICTSRKINSLSAAEEVFFYRLLVNADDYGCFFGEPDVLSGKLYPRKRVSATEITKWRDKIVDAGLAFLYEDDGETYICVNQWSEHQRMRQAKHKFPAPNDENTVFTNSRQLAATRGENPQNAASRTRAESNPIQSESESESIYICASAKSPPKEKTAYGEFGNVKLSDDEYSKLIAKGIDTAKYIERLDGWLQQSPANKKKCKDCYATIINWWGRDDKPVIGVTQKQGRKSFAELAAEMEDE